MTKNFTSQELSFKYKKKYKIIQDLFIFLFIMFNGQINFKSCIFFKGS